MANFQWQRSNIGIKACKERRPVGRRQLSEGKRETEQCRGPGSTAVASRCALPPEVERAGRRRTASDPLSVFEHLVFLMSRQNCALVSHSERYPHPSRLERLAFCRRCGAKA